MNNLHIYEFTTTDGMLAGRFDPAKAAHAANRCFQPSGSLGKQSVPMKCVFAPENLISNMIRKSASMSAKTSFGFKIWMPSAVSNPSTILIYTLERVNTRPLA